MSGHSTFIQKSSISGITPAYLIDSDLLRVRLNEISRICKSHQVRLLAAAKAVPEDNRIVDLVGSNVAGFDVSNLAELSRFTSRFPDATYSVTSPGVLSLPCTETSRLSMINATTVDQLRQLLASSSKKFKIGVRLAPLVESTSRIADYRFGLDCRALEEVKRSNPTLSVLGLHMHSGSREGTVASKLSKVVDCLTMFSYNKLVPAYVNLGGAVPRRDLKAFESFLRLARSLVGNAVPMYVEPGEFLFDEAITAIGKVLDITVDQNCTKVVVDLSAELHLRWSVPRFELTMADKKIRQIICGPTCYGGDIISVDQESLIDTIAVGDILRFSNVSSYSLAWNCSFNGIPRATISFL
jgi:diaminopimelate decarboxylase